MTHTHTHTVCNLSLCLCDLVVEDIAHEYMVLSWIGTERAWVPDGAVLLYYRSKLLPESRK